MTQPKLYITLFFLGLSHLLVDFMIGIWPIYKTLAGLDVAIMGLIAAFSVFIGEAFQLFFGMLSDKGFRKILIITGLSLTPLSVLISYTDNYYLLFFLFQIVCIGSGAFHPSAASLASSLSKNYKGVFITLFALGGAIGFALSQIVFSHFYLNYNTKTWSLMIPAFLLAILLISYSLDPEFQRDKKKTSNNLAFSLQSITSFFKRKHLRSLYFIQICNQIVVWAFIFLLPDILLARGADNWLVYGGGHLIFIAGYAFMLLPSGFIADKYSYKNVIITATALGAVFFFLFLKFPFISKNALLTLLFLIGASIMVINPLVLAYGNKLYPKESGSISGFLMGFAWCIANPLGQAGSGLLTKLFTDDAAAKALSIIGIFFLIGLGITFLLPARSEVEPEYVV